MDGCDADVFAGDAWVRVEVQGTPIGEPSRVGAVPYAIEANRAEVAHRHVHQLAAAEESVGGVLCGETTPSSVATFGGWTGVKSLCQLQCSGPEAHMCNLDEMVRSANAGILPTQNGWIVGGWGREHASAPIVNACVGWTDATSSYAAQTWDGAEGYPDAHLCSEQRAILCCK
jgi:hypothetical protein